MSEIRKEIFLSMVYYSMGIVARPQTEPPPRPKDNPMRMIPLHFLIDYENVHSAGLRGAELLMEQDTVVFMHVLLKTRLSQPFSATCS